MSVKWVDTYLKERKYIVSLSEHWSNENDILYDALQSSVLGQLLFSLYILPSGHIINKHGVSHDSYYTYL